MQKIIKETPIEELINVFPLAIPLLSKYGIRCLLCGEPTWGTIGSAAKEKFIDDARLDEILVELNAKFTDYLNEKGL
jgi:hypothetical protein